MLLPIVVFTLLPTLVLEAVQPFFPVFLPSGQRVALGTETWLETLDRADWAETVKKGRLVHVPLPTSGDACVRQLSCPQPPLLSSEMIPPPTCDWVLCFQAVGEVTS